jgi:autotransporter passenger strand-loop-strand repeat protein
VSHTVSAGEDYEVLSGQTDIADVVLSAGFMAVRSGGLAIATTVRFGGSLVIRQGGSGRTTALFGDESVYGSEIRDSIGSGGNQDVGRERRPAHDQ